MEILRALILCLALMNSAHARTRVGLGAIFGEPSGFSAKFMHRYTQGVDLGVAYSFTDFLLVYSDYLWHFPGTFGRSPLFIAELRPYVGLGALFLVSTNDSPKKYFEQSGSSIGLGVRLPLGLEWYPTSPLSIYAEVVPGVGVVPTFFGFVQGGIGARIYF